MKRYVIRKEDLIHNIRLVKERAGQARLIAVVKGRGYGLGLVPFSEVLREEGVDYFAVSEMEEALTLRDDGFTESILLLTATTVEAELEEGIRRDITLAVGSVETLNAINRIAEKQGKTATVHIKLDTGFGRYGFLEGELDSLSEALNNAPHVTAEGVFSHFSFAFSPNKQDVAVPYARFLRMISHLEQCGITFSIRHICNSCGFLQYPEYHLDAVRVGSALLGRIPIPNRYGLIPIGKLYAEVMEVRTLPKGHHIGYANTAKTKRETTIAVIPVGYKDGFGVEKSKDTFRWNDILRYMWQDFKSYRKRLTVNINGHTVPLLGRIGMFHAVADVTGLDIKAGDPCILPANPLLVAQNIRREYQ